MFKLKIFSIVSMNRKKWGDHNDEDIMAFALEGKVLEIVKEKVISICGRGHYVML